MAEELAFNPFDTDWRADRYPFFKRLREEAPVGRVPGLGAWYLTRYADCENLMRDRRIGSDTRKSPLYRMLAESSGLRMPADIMRHRSFMLVDPPDHTRLRGLVSRAFTPRMVQTFVPHIQELTDTLLDRAEAQGRFEVIGDLAYPLAFQVICSLVGVPPDDQPRFRAWSKVLSATIDPSFDTPPEVAQRQLDAMVETIRYFQSLVDERRRQPVDGLISTLIEIEAEGDRLSQEELVATLILLMAAGHETTVYLIANAIIALLQHPEQFALLRSQPTLATAAVDEVLRWDPPVQLTQRIALEDMEFNGASLQAGMPVVLVLAAANRDEAVAADGERFDIRRQQIRHLGFAAGPHHCLGASLARLEGQIALTTLARRLPGIRLVPDGLRYRNSMVLRGPESLLVDV